MPLNGAWGKAQPIVDMGTFERDWTGLDVKANSRRILGMHLYGVIFNLDPDIHDSPPFTNDMTT
jgi:hypothetical protein